MMPAEMAEIHESAFKTLRPWTEDEFASLLESPLVFVISVASGSFALARIVADEAELLTIATHVEKQRQGQAAACLNEFVTYCKKSGCASIFLEVDASNAPAQALYLQADFIESGRRTDYYRLNDGSRSDAILMTRTLIG